MQKIFQHIRSQPKPARDKYALAVAGVFTFVVMGVWLVAKTDEGGENIAAESQVPFATFIKETREQFSALKDNFGETEEDTQVAGVVAATAVATTSIADTFILSQDTVNMVNEVSASNTNYRERTSYQEVLVGTTSASYIEVETATSGGGTTAL